MIKKILHDHLHTEHSPPDKDIGRKNKEGLINSKHKFQP